MDTFMDNLLDNIGITINVADAPSWPDYVAQRKRMRRWWMPLARIFAPRWYRGEVFTLSHLGRKVQVDIMNMTIEKHSVLILEEKTLFTDEMYSLLKRATHDI